MLSGARKSMRSSHEHDACDMKCACKDDSSGKRRKLCNLEPLSLEPHAKSDLRV